MPDCESVTLIAQVYLRQLIGDAVEKADG